MNSEEWKDTVIPVGMAVCFGLVLFEGAKMVGRSIIGSETLRRALEEPKKRKKKGQKQQHQLHEE